MAVDEKKIEQFLTFVLDGELFALDIFTVREVLEYTHITRIPRTPGYMRGIINVRGNAVPVVDLNQKFGREATARTVLTSIIIVEVEADGESVHVGALADEVREVVDMSSDSIDPPPKMGTSVNAEFIRGMGRQGDAFVMVLDVTKLFTAEELSIMESAGTAEETAEA